MEYILISLFGGGTADWQDISKTNYDWEDIFDRAKIDFDMGNIGRPSAGIDSILRIQFAKQVMVHLLGNTHSPGFRLQHQC